MAFGMRVLACDPAKRPNDVEEGVELMSLQDMLSRADLVTLHVNLTPQTEAFFGATEFERLKKGAWFINTARGELVDESALLSALETGRLAGAALDVLARESSTGMGEHPLVRYARTHCNLLITPHIGGCTYESVQKTEEFLAGKLVWALSAGPERA
jgi:D-3-phosphoglycerate dehydrogenase